MVSLFYLILVAYPKSAICPVNLIIHICVKVLCNTVLLFEAVNDSLIPIHQEYVMEMTSLFNIVSWVHIPAVYP